MKNGDKYIHTDRFGNKHELTYSGTRREIKGCEFEVFYNYKNECCFFTDEEVTRMEKSIPWPKPLDEILKESGIELSQEEQDRKFKDGIRYIQG